MKTTKLNTPVVKKNMFLSFPVQYITNIILEEVILILQERGFYSNDFELVKTITLPEQETTLYRNYPQHKNNNERITINNNNTNNNSDMKNCNNDTTNTTNNYIIGTMFDRW